MIWRMLPPFVTTSAMAATSLDVHRNTSPVPTRALYTLSRHIPTLSPILPARHPQR